MNFEKWVGTQIYMAKWTLIYVSQAAGIYSVLCESGCRYSDSVKEAAGTLAVLTLQTAGRGTQSPMMWSRRLLLSSDPSFRPGWRVRSETNKSGEKTHNCLCWGGQIHIFWLCLRDISLLYMTFSFNSRVARIWGLEDGGSSWNFLEDGGPSWHHGRPSWLEDQWEAWNWSCDLRANKRP